MATKHDLVDWLYQAIRASGGGGRIADLCKYVWENHEQELRASGDLFHPESCTGGAVRLMLPPASLGSTRSWAAKGREIRQMST